MKVIGSICLSYGTEQSIVQQIPPFDDEVYHIYTQLLPLDQIEGDSQAQYIGGKLCVTAPHMLAYWCVSQVMSPLQSYFGEHVLFVLTRGHWFGYK